MKYCLIPLGCQMNKSDSERISSVIEAMNYKYTDNEEEADLLGIVACSVRQRAIDRVYGRIAKWNRWKNKRSLLTFVSGCILEEDEKKFLKLFDFVFRMTDINKIPEIINHYGVVIPAAINLQKNSSSDIFIPSGADNFDEGFWDIKPRYNSSFEAFIPIQNGCDKFCTYCAVPYTRGREVSRSSDEIINELESLVDAGYKSITLLGQNVNSYGLDKKGNEISFHELLKKIGEYGNSRGNAFWVYFTSPHPRDMNDEVLEVISKYSCLAKQLHLPLQSGDNEVLKKMNRNYTVENYAALVNRIRNMLPEATLFTDIIVGFSGEAEEHFLNTVKSLKEFKYNMAYIAAYSPRPGAVSNEWDDDVSHSEKKKRLHILTDIFKETSLKHNLKMIGKTYRVLVEGSDRNNEYLLGKTEGKIIVRFLSDDLSLIDRFAEIKINSITPLAVEGELVKTHVICQVRQEII